MSVSPADSSRQQRMKECGGGVHAGERRHVADLNKRGQQRCLLARRRKGWERAREGTGPAAMRASTPASSVTAALRLLGLRGAAAPSAQDLDALLIEHRALGLVCSGEGRRGRGRMSAGAGAEQARARQGRRQDVWAAAGAPSRRSKQSPLAPSHPGCRRKSRAGGRRRSQTRWWPPTRRRSPTAGHEARRGARC